MSGGSVLAFVGALIALFAPLALPFITVNEEELALHSFDVSTGLASLAVAAGTALLAAWIYKTRKRQAGWGVALLSMAQLGLMALTNSEVWALIPARSLGLLMADPGTGGLIPDTLVTLDWGIVCVVLGAVLSLVAGLLVVAAHAEYTKEQRFLRLIVSWDNQTIYERVLFSEAPVTVGESDRAYLQLAAGGLSLHELFNPVGPGKYAMVVPTAIGGVLSVGGTRQDAAGFCGEIQQGDAGLLHFDNGVAVAFQFTGAESGTLAAALGRDPALSVAFAGTTVAAFMMLLAMFTGSRGRQRMTPEEELEKRGQELIEFSLAVPEPPPEVIPLSGEEQQTTAKRPEGEEGKVGDPQKDPTKASKIPKLESKKDQPVDVTKIGMTEVLGGFLARDGALGQVMAGNTGALESKMPVATSGEGAELEIGGGSGGKGWRDIGSGGGKDGLGRIQGLGIVDTGRDVGLGAHVVIGKKRPKAVGTFKIASGQSTGGCDKGDIAKNVRARSSALRACYETQLLAKPELAGKITAQWTISPDGSVTGEKAVDDSMHNDTVSDCVLRSLKRIHFAKPEAGICVIQWPFVFSPG